MPAWKKNIFVRVIRYRMEKEGRTAEDILAQQEQELRQRTA